MDKKIILSTETTVLQQTKKTVTGIVKDQNGEPVIGANVVEKGTRNGTVTDIDGKYSLSVSYDAVLQISYIGYISKDVSTTDRTVVDVIIQENSQTLDEVVVVGYGTQKRVNLSGAVETVNAKALESRATANIGVALQGVVPNLNIVSGGQANSVPEFNIRGTNSINGGTPLILVDGIPTDAAEFSRMNSMDIENISILKDASSAAIYGARASFGVILVTTKRGKGEKLVVHFNNNFNMRTLSHLPKIVKDPYIQASYKDEMGKPWYDLYDEQELAYAKLRSEDASLSSVMMSTQTPGYWKHFATTDWFDEVYRSIGTSNSHNLSVSGSTGKVSYYLGSEYYGERGMLRENNDVYNRYNVRSKTLYSPTEWLTVGNNTAFTYFDYEKPTALNNTVFLQGNGLFAQINQTNTLLNVYNPDGSYTKDGSQLIGALKDGGQSVTKQSTILTQFTADIKLIKDVWNVKADFTFKHTGNKENIWSSDKAFPYREGPDLPAVTNGWQNYAAVNQYSLNYNLLNIYSDFQKEFGMHSLSATVGFSQESERYGMFNGRRNDLITDSYPTPELATGEMTMRERKYEWAIRSGFYRLNYILKGRYIIETNGRYDGTSRFPKTSRFGFFPSFSAAWILSEENFFQSLKEWFDYAKIRVSYGSLGNQDVEKETNPLYKNYYQYIANMNASKIDMLINGQKPMGVYAPGLVASTLTREKVNTINVGVDVNFLSNRLSLSGDVYRRNTLDMLTKGKTLPNVLGTSEPQVNAADLKTRGWEVSVSWRDQFMLNEKPFTYGARFILADSRTFITRFDNPTGYLGDFYEGQELGEMWGLTTDGFFKDQADIDNHADQWEVTSYPGDRPIEPGDLKYVDVNGDGKINKGKWTKDDPGDFKVIGNSSDRYTFGLNLNAEWNGLDFRALFQGVGKKTFIRMHLISSVFIGRRGQMCWKIIWIIGLRKIRMLISLD
ncbi:MAG: TonB-dependent receptor [Parabacteroides sp.]|nr:TonB-dependent receptor [Parabacteroides sp.]